MWYYQCEDKNYALNPGTLIYYPYGLPYCITSNNSLLFYTVNFDLNDIDISVSEEYEKTLIKKYNPEIEREIEDYIHVLDEVAEANNYSLVTLFVTDIINNGSYVIYSTDSNLSNATKVESTSTLWSKDQNPDDPETDSDSGARRFHNPPLFYKKSAEKNEIKAEVDGIVKEIKVSQGDTVQADDVLAVIAAN